MKTAHKNALRFVQALHDGSERRMYAMLCAGIILSVPEGALSAEASFLVGIQFRLPNIRLFFDFFGLFAFTQSNMDTA